MRRKLEHARGRSILYVCITALLARKRCRTSRSSARHRNPPPPSLPLPPSSLSIHQLFISDGYDCHDELYEWPCARYDTFERRSFHRIFPRTRKQPSRASEPMAVNPFSHLRHPVFLLSNSCQIYARYHARNYAKSRIIVYSLHFHNKVQDGHVAFGFRLARATEMTTVDSPSDSCRFLAEGYGNPATPAGGK